MTKRIFVFVALLSAVCVTGAFAQVTVSGGFALSSVNDVSVSMGGETVTGSFTDAEIGLGANLFVDYLLPIGVPLSLGGELGFDSATLNKDPKQTVSVIPLLLRAAYHFDLMPKLDLYVVGKIGFAIGFLDGVEGVDNPAGVGFGFDVGAAYYFNSKIGVFAEFGFDDYALETKGTVGDVTITYKLPFYRFATIGISGKF
jgi:hypothetical protein